VGACAALSDADKIAATYRGHGWVVEADISPPQFSARSAIDNQASTVGGLAHLEWRRQNEQQYRGASCGPLMSSL
jgi:TPP-dependent pyruvate/acetoin dehydrogenase alpha subunit